MATIDSTIDASDPFVVGLTSLFGGPGNGFTISGTGPYAVPGKYSVSGTITGFPYTDWIAIAEYTNGLGIAGVQRGSGSSYAITGIANKDSVVVTLRPRIGSAWSAGKVYATGTYTHPKDAITTPFFFKVTAGGGGYSGATEPTWPTTPGATVSDGDLTWTCQNRLIQPIEQGPLMPV